MYSYKTIHNMRIIKKSLIVFQMYIVHPVILCKIITIPIWNILCIIILLQSCLA